jgi:hypothetical protein
VVWCGVGQPTTWSLQLEVRLSWAVTIFITSLVQVNSDHRQHNSDHRRTYIDPVHKSHPELVSEYNYQSIYKKNVGGGGLPKNLYISPSWVDIRFHTKNQLPSFPVSRIKVCNGGVVGYTPIALSLLLVFG